MADLVITYVDAVSNKPISKQLSGDIVGVRHDAGFLIAGSARRVTKVYDGEDSSDPLNTYEDHEGIEEFHIPERAVYMVSVLYDPPKSGDINASEITKEEVE